MKAEGKIVKYGDNIDTDVIIPARYLNTSDPKELALHCMEDLDTGFVEKVKTCSIMVAGDNFGCGSSREHAPISIKESGIKCIVAKSFARIFYRNAINIGLAIIDCPQAVEEACDGDTFSIDFDNGSIVNQTKNKTYKIHPFPEFIQKVIQENGLISMVKKQFS